RNLGEVLKSVAPERASASATSSTPIKEAVPLLESPTADPARLAQALSGALGRSGLFYESHQAQWILGHRPVAELLHEPQGRLSALAQDPDRGARLNSAAGTPQGGDDRVEESTLAPKPSAADEKTPPVHPQTLPQVRSQLDALETHQLVWQGQLWPGQDLEW